jgi:hypothetical protein
MMLKALIFVGGVATGLYIAKLYARNKTESAVHDVLSKIGLSGGAIEETANRLIVPSVSG